MQPRRDRPRARQHREPGGERVADLGAQLDALEPGSSSSQGRLEVERAQRAGGARRGARRARGRLDGRTGARSRGQPRGGSPGEAARQPEAPAAGAAPSASRRVQAYRNAYADWRSGNAPACIDRFREFLQTYPASELRRRRRLLDGRLLLQARGLTDRGPSLRRRRHDSIRRATRPPTRCIDRARRCSSWGRLRQGGGQGVRDGARSIRTRRELPKRRSSSICSEAGLSPQTAGARPTV